MISRSSLSILFFSVVIAACSPQGEEPPTSVSIPTAIAPAGLPTAVGPAEVTGIWAVSFDHAFPPGFWPLGQHEYGFFIDCPLLDQLESAGEYRIFQVTNAASRFDGPIYFRLAGLSTGVLAPINIDSLHPDQASIAVVTMIGITEEQALGAATSDDCEVVFGWDGIAAESLSAGEPFQP